MLFNAKNLRIPLKFHIYSICNVRFKCFRSHVRRLNSDQIVRKAMLLSAAVTSASSKINAATLNLLPKVIYALCFNGHQVYQFSPKNHPHPLHFQCRKLITGRTISKISMSFHHALMTLGIRRSAMDISDGQLRYSKITRGCSFCSASRCLTVNIRLYHEVPIQAKEQILHIQYCKYIAVMLQI